MAAGMPSIWSGAALVIYASSVLYFVTVTKRDNSETQAPLGSWLSIGLLLLPFIAIAATRLALFLASSDPLGYDTGLYRAVQADFVRVLPDLPEFAPRAWGEGEPSGLYLLADLLHLGGWSTDGLLYGFLLGSQLLLATGVWLVARDLGGRAAGVWAVFLIAVSSTQLDAFWLVYYKQTLALALFLYLIWFWRRQSWLAVPLGALVAGVHHMTFLLLGLVLLTDFLWPDGVRWADLRSGQWRVLSLSEAKRYQLVSGTLILLAGLSYYAINPDPITRFLFFDVSQTVEAFGLSGDLAGGGTFFGPALTRNSLFS